MSTALRGSAYSRRPGVANLGWARAPDLGLDVLVLTVLSTIDAESAGLLRDRARRGLLELASLAALAELIDRGETATSHRPAQRYGPRHYAARHCPALLVDLRAITRLGVEGLAALVDVACGHPSAGLTPGIVRTATSNPLPGPSRPGSSSRAARGAPLRLLVDPHRPAVDPGQVHGLEHLLGIHCDPDSAAHPDDRPGCQPGPGEATSA